ncbi:predicted protein [Micromonas commoda]|uniref:TLDc domain-containing protein n=1 Tax=Micromonas commoda (strain RCC299 / NOUM17 / CCMP2709) TaxID=296587 RepID=C1E6V5_MICCC|nr:predicted protein [Micromonas commoda]ACO63871.1 predicted protein [Micromonas commoda]|eukprot:XP_002502613.1 predicted protein [Micromonas commoda]
MSVVASATSPGSVVSPRATRVLSRRVAPTARRPTVRVNAGEANDDDQELDFVTRMVMNVFGKDALDDPEPMGLKRMTKEEWPDQWPALVDGTVAELLPTDDTPELKMARAVCKQTQLEFQPLGLAYDANVHGWRASSFHTQLDGQGAAILVATAADGTVFGGYNPKGWLGYGEWLDAISAFLFVYPRGPLGVGGGGKAVKLAKCGGSGMAIIDEDNKGPKWGPDGLQIDLENRTARSRLGTYYDKMPGGGKSMFGGVSLGGGGGAAQLRDLRVYVALGDSEKAKNYVPNMFQFGKGELEKLRENDPKPGEPRGDGGGFKMPKMPWD